jgi:hypothetical protein
MYNKIKFKRQNAEYTREDYEKNQDILDELKIESILTKISD